ncbi:MAG: C40 family peptidase [Anaerovoracaceae bacterium]
MKTKLLTILLVLSLVFTMSFGTVSAYADDSVFTVLSDNPVEDDSLVFELAGVSTVTAKALGKTSIRVSWDAAPGAEGYKVYHYSASKDSYVLLKTVDADTTAYTHKGLDPDTTKYYKVASYVNDADGNEIISDLSSKAKATTEDSGSVEKIMALAKSKLGCPYSAGAAGPNAFDCSGFVWYVYNKTDAGKISFSRSSAQGEYSQIKKYSIGKNKSDAQIGDIIFFSASGSTSGINHVGIYAGGGRVIHAGSYRTGISYCSFSALSACGRNVCAIVRLAK